MIRLYMDENGRGAVIRGLRALGVDVLTAAEDGAERLPDPIDMGFSFLDPQPGQPW